MPTSSPFFKNRCHPREVLTSVSSTSAGVLTLRTASVNASAISSMASSPREWPPSWAACAISRRNRPIKGIKSALYAAPVSFAPILSPFSITTGSVRIPRTICCHKGLSLNFSWAAMNPSVKSVGPSSPPKSPRITVGICLNNSATVCAQTSRGLLTNSTAPNTSATGLSG